jgi:hypothetical protein
MMSQGLFEQPLQNHRLRRRLSFLSIQYIFFPRFGIVLILSLYRVANSGLGAAGCELLK